MPTIEQTYIIQSVPEDVWDALINPERIRVWSGATAEFKPEPGAEYWLWDGDIRGKVLEAEPHKRLTQTWKPRNWDVEDSVVTFVLTPTEEGTQVDLVHENVQDWDYDGTAEGWDIYYLGAIQRMIEGQSENRPAMTKKRAAAKKAAPKKNNPPAAKKSATGAKTTAKKVTPKKAAKKTPAKKGATPKRAKKQ
ncbi:MAG: SRPBCC domain-containing protein [Anaerolineae bacterium]